MLTGIPVVATTAGSLPEVIGDAALLTDPWDVDEIADGLDRVVSDAGLRADLVERGHARAARYQWAEAGDELVALYRKVAERA